LLNSSALTARERRVIHLTLVVLGAVVLIIGLFTVKELMTLGIFLLGYGGLSALVDRRRSARKAGPGSK
jgi:dolichol kinase